MSANERIRKFNQKRLEEIMLIQRLLEKTSVKSAVAYKVNWETMRAEVILTEAKNKFSDDVLDYYWVEFKKDNTEYKISLYYKDFDSNTGSVHVLPGAVQLWEKEKSERNEDEFICEKARRRGYGIVTYSEYGWTPKYEYPLFLKDDLDEDKLKNLMTEDYKGEMVLSNEFYREVLETQSQRVLELKQDSKNEGMVGRPGHYMKYALIKWLAGPNDIVSCHETYLIKKQGLFSKYGTDTEQRIEESKWEIEELKAKYGIK